MTAILDASAPGIAPPRYCLPASARVGRVRLAVSHVQRSVAFYTEIIGLSVLRQRADFATLGVGENGRVLLELEEVAGVQPITRGTRLGLYHTAILLPSRADLSSFVEQARRLGVPFGAGDHAVSEAIYLVDPDGLSVEVYADRNRGSWTIRNGEIVTGTAALDLGGLLAAPHEPWRGVPAGTVMGHIHFYVGDMDQGTRFYHHGLGMNIMTSVFPGALFVAAGGYHHHVAFNIWAAGSPQAAQTDARVLFWELLLPDEKEVIRVAASLATAGWQASASDNGDRMISDPWGINVLLSADQGRIA